MTTYDTLLKLLDEACDDANAYEADDRFDAIVDYVSAHAIKVA